MTDHRSPVKFVVFAAARTGSNLLCGLLNSHPQILCHHGLFNSEGIHYAIDHRDGTLDFGSSEQRDMDPAAFLDRVWKTDLGMRAVGFKLNRDEHDAAIKLVTPDPGIRKVILRRRNRLKTYVSALIAEQTGQWESYGKAESGEPPRAVHVDPDALRTFVATIENFYSQLRGDLARSGQTFFSIDYETLTSPAELRRLLSYLEVSPFEPSLSAPSFKRNPRELSRTILNFAELESALRGSEFEDDLYRPDLPPLSEVRLGELHRRPEASLFSPSPSV